MHDKGRLLFPLLIPPQLSACCLVGSWGLVLALRRKGSLISLAIPQ